MKKISNRSGSRNTIRDAADTDLQALLKEGSSRNWLQRQSIWLGAACLIVLLVGLSFWWFQSDSDANPSYVSEVVKRGNLTLNVTANGTLQPTRSVNIGSELSGTVKQVFVDVNDRVKVGQVLLSLDTAKLSDQVLRSRATLASSQAQLALSTATLKEVRANLLRFEEVARLSGGKVPSATELDNARAVVDRAAASQNSAQANVADAKAALSTEETNLSKAAIRSPIDGVILTRTVDAGNAVAASLQAVTLFTIAEDLTQLRLDVSVDEADVGTVLAGQKASFTVSAHPARKYPATVTRVAFGSTKTDNVITYTSSLAVDNSDLSLRPGMTAAATITTIERTGVLLVPNTALRFTPAQTTDNPEAEATGGLMSKLVPRFRMTGSGKHKAPAVDAAGLRPIWVLKNSQAVQIMVKTGISDGRMTEVSGEALQEGMAVITDQRTEGPAP